MARQKKNVRTFEGQLTRGDRKIRAAVLGVDKADAIRSLAINFPGWTVEGEPTELRAEKIARKKPKEATADLPMTAEPAKA